MISDTNNCIENQDILEQVITHGIKAMLPIMSSLMNEAMKINRGQTIQADPYQRTDERKGYANGFKKRTFQTRSGPLKIKIPQVRGLSFYPKCLEKGERSERALKLAIAESYIHGVSTRRVSKVMEELCGFEVSSTQVSKCSKLLDEELEIFRNRPLDGHKYAYIYLDAEYEKVRHNHSVIDMSTLIAIGVNENGFREILGVSSKLSEAEIHWRDFLQSLQKRGLSGVRLLISDAHEGLRAARKAVYPSIKWQRCQFHMAQNAQSYVPKKSMKEEIGDAVREIFNSKDLKKAIEEKKNVIERYKEKAPEFANWVDNNIEEGFTCFCFPKKHQQRIRTTNPLERINREVKRRTNVATIFPNVAACERLITAVLQNVHEEWMIGRRYLDMSLLE